MNEKFQQIRLLEAVLFAASEPLGPTQLLRHLPETSNLDELLEELRSLYANRGIHLVRVGNRWAFRSAPDLAPHMKLEKRVVRKLSRVAMETLAIIAYHQPITRAEVEEIRGVALSKGTLDILLEIGWIRPKGRRRTPGRPVTWGTSETFLDHFGLETLEALPGVEELKAAGLLDARPAVNALAARGDLLSAEEIPADAADLEEEDDEEPLLPEDFGEDLVETAEVSGDAEILEDETRESEEPDLDVANPAASEPGTGVAATTEIGPEKPADREDKAEPEDRPEDRPVETAPEPLLEGATPLRATVG